MTENPKSDKARLPAFLVFLLVLVALGSALQLFAWMRADEAPIAEPGNPVIEAYDRMPDVQVEPLAVTAVDLEKAFDENEVAAQAKYGAQPLLISGKVTAITLDSSDLPNVHLESGALLNLVVSLSLYDSAAAAQLKKGDRVKVLCNKIGEMLGKPMVDECVLAKQ